MPGLERSAFLGYDEAIELSLQHSLLEFILAVVDKSVTIGLAESSQLLLKGIPVGFDLGL